MRELELLEHVYRANASLPAGVTLGPGDDMGAVRIADGEVLVTVDQVADGVHFRLGETPVDKIGRKAITRNLSDVAAMAALPIGAVVAAALPRDFGGENARQLFDAMRRTAANYDCPLFGGDITIWGERLIISVTVLARPAGVTPIRRDGAKPGDVICVTGELGGSLQRVTGEGGASVHHLDFEPRIALARALATDRDLHLHSMIDLSDGLATDLMHICRASRAAAELWVDRLPVSAAAHAAAHRDGVEPWQHALTDGEDYELCFTLDAAEADRALPAQVASVKITRIGVIAAGEPEITLKLPDGRIAPLEVAGWEHRDNPGDES